MNIILISKLLKWTANIVGGLIAAFFFFMIIAHLVEATTENKWVPLTSTEILMFIFMGTALLGLILSYFRRLPGAILAIIGSGLFITTESISRGAIFPISNGFFFYLILFTGILHLCSCAVTKNSSVHEITG